MKTDYTVAELEALLSELDSGVLKRGSHKSFGNGREFCAMEFVAKVAGEPWTDDPVCVHPALSSYARTLNDTVWANDAERTRVLLPLLCKVFGTSDLKISVARIAEATIREIVPLALEVAATVAVGDHPTILREAAERCKTEGTQDAAEAAARVASFAAAAASFATDEAIAATNAASFAAEAAAASAASFAAAAAIAAAAAKERSVALVIAEIDRARAESGTPKNSP